MAAWTSCSSPLKRLMALPDISYSARRSSISRTSVPLSASSAARTLAATVSVSRIATASCATGCALAEDGVMHLRVDIGQEGVVQPAGLADGQRFVERFLDRGGRAADDDQVAAAADGAGLDHGDGRFLQQRVGAVDAVGDAAELDDRDGRVFPHQTILNAPTSVQRRQREKLRGLVMPSPVGLAMVNEV